MPRRASSPADAAPLASLMAMQTGGSAQDYAAGMDIGEPIALVLCMLLFASLIHPSLCAIKEGLGFEGEVEPLPRGMEVVPQPTRPALAQRAASLLAPPKPERPKRGRNR